jgi:hypothetical protein
VNLEKITMAVDWLRKWERKEREHWKFETNYHDLPRISLMV